jgi:hypothetical protein
MVQIDFPKMSEVSQLGIYWFDDTGVGECRVPESWKVFYKDGEKWNPFILWISMEQKR